MTLDNSTVYHGTCKLDEYDCGDIACKTHHSQCGWSRNGQCWHDHDQCRPRQLAKEVIDMHNNIVNASLEELKLAHKELELAKDGAADNARILAGHDDEVRYYKGLKDGYERALEILSVMISKAENKSDNPAEEQPEASTEGV